MTPTYFKTKEQIEEETGRDFKELILELTEQGMAPIEITKKLQLKSTDKVNYMLLEERRNKERSKLTNEDFILPDLKGLHRDDVEIRFRNELGIEYKDFLKQKYLDEKLSLYELSLLTNISIPALQRAMEKYKLNKSPSQARRDAIDKGLIDYNEVKIKARKTKAKANGFSNIQETFRELIKYHLESKINQLNNMDIEVIIGFNEWGILKDREVDIPIIIIIDTNKLLKYSIEYNGDNWHDDKQTKKTDKAKQKHLKERGWNHIIFTETPNQSKNMKPLEDKARKISDQIVNDILNYNN